ncbi:hypothetical protein GRX01_00310 [Halobaculum sp. WSA2]|uniref:Uncharacterized protein n=1 Tax=Halobaculum saliterrae TaxID=2073113 RepID=A0A6B0SLL8_9EURY|nr:hypothetical protein [Halobaculum saliterrae]MXR39804.1 hypothetical protein [Halobaculum saliterrae]
MTNENAEATETTRRTVLAALGGAAATAAGAGTASAQENATNATTSTDTPEGPEIAVELGPVVTVRSWEYTDGRFELELVADYPTSVKITDTGAIMDAMTAGDGTSATRIPTRGYSIESEPTRITFEPVEFDGAYAITVASAKGAALLRTDSVDAGSPTVAYSTAGALTASAAVGTGYLSFKRSREKLEESDEPEIDRVA